MNRADDSTDGIRRPIFQKVNTGPVLSCTPFRGDAAGGRAKGEDKYSSLLSAVEDTRGCSLRGIAAGARMSKVSSVQRLKCLFQLLMAPVERMVVGPTTAIDAGDGKTADVLRSHAVEDLFIRPICCFLSDRCAPGAWAEYNAFGREQRVEGV